MVDGCSTSASGLALCAAALVLVIVSCWTTAQRWNGGRKVGPRTWPLIGAAIEQLANYDRMHDWLAEYLSNSPSIFVPMPFASYTYTTHPSNVEHILKTNFHNYPKGDKYHSCMEVLLGDGIFNSDGEMWRKQRKTASFEFASRNLRDFSTTVFREYALKLSHILCLLSKNNQQIDVQELLMRMTLDSIGKVGFGTDINTLSPQLPDNEFARAFDAANTIVTMRFLDPLWRIKRFFQVGSEALLNQSIKFLDDFTYAMIRKRKAEIEEARANGMKYKIKHDILSRFIELGEESDSRLTEKTLRDIVLNFVIAGRDTTATTLSWFIYMMIKNPQAANKVRKELEGLEEEKMKEKNKEASVIITDHDDVKSFTERISRFAEFLTYDSLGKLLYLHAAISETLRLYPAVPQDPKGILKDDILPDGTKVRAGEMVTYVPYSMGRMEYLWGHDAAEFKPERWIKDGVLQQVSPFKFTAFQGGPRVCLGKDSAFLQMKMTLAILCRFFDFNLVPNHPVRYRLMTILSMAHGLKVTVSRRL
ncbi:cytochrome P450 704B1 [Nymphaea colorata]|nr:cytochrome P450 704B1 [Nymphaea colorata]